MVQTEMILKLQTETKLKLQTETKLKIQTEIMLILILFNQKKKRKTNQPFRRITATELENPEIANYKKVDGDDWAKKAYQDLKGVKGDRFRHEKTKKKRGSYKGDGANITMEVHSIRLDNSDDDDE